MTLEIVYLFHLIIFVTSLSTVSTACSSGCTSCTGSNCTRCESSYYLSIGNCFQCLENCDTCNSYHVCTSCKSNKWGILNQCRFNCATECLNTECQDDNGYCFRCKQGNYGSMCQHNCSLCENGLCDLLVCTNGCKFGYYDYNTGTETICQVCPQNCKSCNSSYMCDVCNDGYRLNNFTSNGNVYGYCVQCPPEKNCRNCEDMGTPIVCTGCNEGYVLDGDMCILNENYCHHGCSTDCTKDGICSGGCYAGWSGERCSDSCASQCLKCEKSNINTCLECNGDNYTVTCDVGCEQSCIKEAGKNTCRQSDGYCNNGCENKYWGQNCKQSCSDGCAGDGVSRMCYKDTGTCTDGCVDGYVDEKCEIAISINSTDHSSATTDTPTRVTSHENTDTKTHFITGYMSGIGTAIFMFAIATALYHLRRRYIAKNSKPNNEGNATDETSTYYNENAAETREPAVELVIDANNYESLAGNRNTEKVYSELESNIDQQKHNYYNI